jgi:hypothetical protein
MINNQQNPISENDPSVQVRTDLWNTMNSSQLNRQRELLLDKLSKIQSIMIGTATPSILNIYNAIQLGLDDITTLIDRKQNQRK